MRYAASIGVAMALVASSPMARADGASAAAAEALFSEGRRLMNAGDFANACPKFADSERLDPSVATLLNLGACYEKAGRTASAWATFRAAVSAAQAAKRDDYLSTAQKRASALEPTLSRVIISEKDTSVQGLEIKRDGVAVTQAEWGVPIPVVLLGAALIGLVLGAMAAVLRSIFDGSAGGRLDASEVTGAEMVATSGPDEPVGGAPVWSGTNRGIRRVWIALKRSGRATP